MSALDTSVVTSTSAEDEAKAERLAEREAKKAASVAKKEENKRIREEKHAAAVARRREKKAAHEARQEKARILREAKKAERTAKVTLSREAEREARSALQRKTVAVSCTSETIEGIIRKKMEKYGEIVSIKAGNYNGYIVTFADLKSATEATETKEPASFSCPMSFTVTSSQVDFTSLAFPLPEGSKFKELEEEIHSLFAKYGKVRCVRWFRRRVVVSYENVTSRKNALAAEKLTLKSGIVVEASTYLHGRKNRKRPAGAPDGNSTDKKMKV